MWVVKLGGSLLGSGRRDDPFETCGLAPGDPSDTRPLALMLQVLVREGSSKVVIVPGGGAFADAVRDAQARWRFDDLTAHNMAVLAMVQNAHLLCGLHASLRRCDREADLQPALTAGHVAVWAPHELLREQADHTTTWDHTSDSIALDLARRLNAQGLLIVKSCDVEAQASLRKLGAAGVIDARLAAHAADALECGVDIQVCGPALPDQFIAGLCAAARD
jgi:aspartokinase-like uncharacterized kinase